MIIWLSPCFCLATYTNVLYCFDIDINSFCFLYTSCKCKAQTKPQAALLSNLGVWHWNVNHHLWSHTIVSATVDPSFLCYTKCDGLKHLTAQSVGQPLQCGQILNLQVIRSDVAVLDGAVVELTEKFLEDIADADACEKTALLNTVVQRLWDETFVARVI